MSIARAVALALWVVTGIGCGSALADEEEEAALLEQLRSLGYAEWAEIPKDEVGGSGVVQNLPGAQPGVVFYHSRTRSRAHLLSPDGRLLHTWRGSETPKGWHHVELLPDGGLLVVRLDGVVERMAFDSRPIWERDLAAHHDAAVDPNGGLHVLSHRLSETRFAGSLVPVVEDRVTSLSADGRPSGQISLLDLVRERVPAERLRAIALAPAFEPHASGRPLHGLVDVLHANTLELLPRDVPDLGRRGDLLVGLRELDLVAVVDVREQRIGWSFGLGELDRPHQPSLLANGNILAFDNGPSRGYSRVVEIDPRAQKIVWQYAGAPGERFYSEKMGGCQGLPNGNVLITESAAGRAFEVDRQGRIVWEFRNPELSAQGRKRAAIHRLSKHAPAEVPEALRLGGRSPAEEPR